MADVPVEAEARPGGVEPVPTTVRRGDLVRHVLRSDRTWWWMLGLTALGLVIRLVWVGYAARTPQGLYDPARYYGIAQNIADGRGYTEIFRLRPGGQLAEGQASAYYPPGYPWFVGVIAWVVKVGAVPGSVATVVGVVQAFLGAVSALFLGVIGRRVWSARAGAVATGMMALYPNLVMHSASILSETLFIFLLLGAVVLLVTASDDPGWRRLALVGGVLGLALLVRTVVAPFVPVLFLAWWLERRRPLPALRSIGVVVVGLLVVVAPWTIRNAVRMHAFIPVATNNGDNLCIGYEPGASGVYGAGRECIVDHVQMAGSRDEVLHDHETTRVALRYARRDVGRLPRLVWNRAVGLFDRDDDAVRAVQSYGQAPFMSRRTEKVLRVLADGAWVVVGIGGAAGLALLAARGRRDRLVVVLGGISLVLAPLATFADPRFKVPFVPFLCLGLAVLAAQLSGSRARPAPRTPRA